MKAARLLAVCFVALASVPAIAIDLGYFSQFNRTNRHICGKLLDFTNNSWSDQRIWSPALCQKRDVYVYLPPNYDPNLAYPVIFYLHGIMQDESQYIGLLIRTFDNAMREGRLPHAIVVVPDGSIQGRPSLANSGSFFMNCKAGRFEDFITQDVWNFVTSNFKIRPEPEAHVLVGSSMGGTGAFSIALRHQHQFRVAIGVFPAVNVLWEDCRGKYFSNFSPCCQGTRSELKPHEVVGKFFGGLWQVRYKSLIEPVFGLGPDALGHVAAINPYTILDTHDIRDGQVAMHISYGGKDQFNIDAQCESFLYHARERGIRVDSEFDPNGRHDIATAVKFFPGAADWLRPRLAPFSPQCR